MRILFLTRKWPPAVGGMEVYCHELVRELQQRADVELRVLPGRSNGKRPSAFAMLAFGLSTAFEIMLKGTKADVVHGGDLAMWPLVFMAALRRRSIRPVLSAHGSDIALAYKRGIAAKFYALYLKLGVLLLRHATILANSRATANLVRQCGFGDVRVVPLATMSPATSPAEPGPYILFVGRLIRRKGCAWFIREVLPLLDSGLRLVVAGVVWDHDEGEAIQRERVEFRGAVFGKNLAELRARATAVIVPNLAMGMEGFEGFGLTAVEGAADGGVVIAADIDGIADAVRDGVTGFLLPAGDAPRWAQKISEISAWTPQQRRAFVETSQEAVSRIYAWARVADETMEAYAPAPRAAEDVLSERADISVVIPAYGAGPHLERTVAALRNQSLPVSRIIISHSGEGDPTARFANTAGVTVLHSPERLYAGAARNRGLALVETEWVAFLDEDMIADAGWHAALQAAIARGEADCIVGSIGSAASGGYWGTSLWFAEFGSVHPYLEPCFFSAGPSANLIVRRDAISAAGGFPEDWPVGEELVMQARLQERGHPIRFEPSVQADHVNLPGFLYTLKHNYPLGRGSAEVRMVFPHLRGSRAVRGPVLSLGLWIARMAQIYGRVLRARKGPRVSLLYHTPGILIAVLAWTLGFAVVAFGKERRRSIGAENVSQRPPVNWKIGNRGETTDR